jgi:hypothetical protein
MATRLMKAPAKPKIQAPKSAPEWQRLMMTAIDRASAANSRLVTGLRDALAKGQSEKFLRKLGIIHQNDIDRLFPRK